MGPEAVKNQYAGSPISTFLRLRVKYTLEPLQAEVGVGISRFIARIMPSRGRKSSPVASMSSSRLNNHRVQIPTVGANALHSSYCRSLHARASMLSFIILTDEDLYRAKHR
jgi:hypothetical protein